jgi:uncharacterized protein (DUF362 family)
VKRGRVVKKSKIALVRADGVDLMVEKAFELSGGLSHVSPGKSFLIKPNVNSNDPFPATSNPETIRALIDYLKRFQPKRIIVADSSNAYYYPTLDSMRKVGILQTAEQAGAEVMGLEKYEFVRVKPGGASHWPKGFEISRIADEVDYIIGQAVIKTHAYAIYTMALKNTIGLIRNKDRPLMHESASPTFWAMVAELNLARPYDFILLDGQRAMVTGGPSSSEVKAPNLMLGSTDIVACDALGLAVLKYLGTTVRIEQRRVWEQPVLARAVELGLGASSADEIEIKAENVPEVEEIKQFLE